MILYDHGYDSIWETPQEMVLVIPTNTAGIQGAGLAASWKRVSPDASDQYSYACSIWPHLLPGDLVVVNDELSTYVCLPTKDRSLGPSKLEWIEKGVDNLARMCRIEPEWTIALPALGCGLGGLPWIDVMHIYERHLEDLPNTILVFEPQ